MNKETLARILINYEKAKSMLDPIRYAGTDAYRGNAEDYYFPKTWTHPETREQRDAEFDRRAAAGEFLEMLLSGGSPAPGEMEKHLGFSAEAFAAYWAEINPIKKPIPDKLVLLTLDDGYRDQLTHAVPVLKRYGFGATFFVNGTAGKDPDRFLDYSGIRALAEAGFEIGNHTLSHKAPPAEFDEAQYLYEIEELNRQLEENGIPRPVSFGYPLGKCRREYAEAARKAGMLWGRGNSPDGICGTNGTSLYRPLCDSPLAMPSYGDAQLYSTERLARRVNAAVGGTILGIAYHGVSDPAAWHQGESFESHMRCLYENGCTVIAMAGLSAYIDPVKAAWYTMD